MNTTAARNAFSGIKDDLPWADGQELIAAPVQSREEAIAAHFESCRKCHGTGKFVGYSGMSFGPCFACKGAGKLSFKSSPEQRAQAAARRQERKMEKQQNTDAEHWLAFRAEHPDVAAWIERSPSFEFAQSLQAAVHKYGRLTERQLAAAQKCAAPRAPATAEAQHQQASGVFAVPKLFAIMQRHSTFHAGELKISRRNQDSLCWLVWNDVCVGKLEDGQCLLFGKRIFAAGTTQATVAGLIREFDVDPLAAAVKYGRLSGRCCSCGRDLTNPDSIDAGIGPVCAGKLNL